MQASDAQPAAERNPSGNDGVDDNDDDADDPEGAIGADAGFEQQMRPTAMAKRKAFGKPEGPQSKVSPQPSSALHILSPHLV